MLFLSADVFSLLQVGSIEDIPSEMVANLGVVSIESDSSSWKGLINEWFFKRPIDERKQLTKKFCLIIDKFLEYILENDLLEDDSSLQDYSSALNMLKIFDVSFFQFSV